MHIEGLMQYAGEDIRSRLRALIEFKAGVGEKYLHKKDNVLNEWVEGMFQLAEGSKQNLGVNKTGMSLLNEFFLKMLYAKADDRMDKK
jgi:hypothetical protein